MHITFLHTADVHVETFNDLLDQLEVSGKRTHVVSPELLSRARQHGLDSVRSEVAQTLSDLAIADVVMCTCSTLGPVADQVSEKFANIFRIDRPLMEEACKHGQDILIALCLESTKSATLDLLVECAKQIGVSVSPRVVLCESAWSKFENGDLDGYATSIANTVKSEFSGTSEPDCIILAQASMRIAEPYLADLNVSVLSSPELAAVRAIQIAKG